MNHTRRLVIIGSTHHNTYSMVRCFGECGIKPDVIIYGKPKSYILHSVFINDSHYVPDAPGALKLLQEFYPEAVVIACTDEIASLMDLQYDRLISRYDFFNCGMAGKLTYFMDKSIQSASAHDAGFLVPGFVKGKPSDINTKELHFPCIIKPLESINGGKNIQICYSENDISKAFGAFDNDVEILIQEYIVKDNEIVIVGLSVANEIILPAYIHKLRDTKGGTTYSLVKPISDIPASVLNSCIDLINRIGYKGLFGIEIIRKGDDYYFVEINLRNDATTYAINVAGCNLPLFYWRICNGETIDNLPSEPVRTISSMVEFNDFIHVLKRRVSIRAWMRQCRESECRFCYSNQDGKAYRIQLNDFFKLIIKLVFSRLHV